MRETDALLQAILYQAEKAKSVKEIKRFIKSMCTKENLDAVAVLLQEEKDDESENQGG